MDIKEINSWLAERRVPFMLEQGEKALRYRKFMKFNKENSYITTKDRLLKFLSRKGIDTSIIARLP